jgi:hypothetical protein
MSRTHHRIRSLGAALAAASALLVAAAPAHADTPGAPGCPPAQLEQPFPGDPAQYVLVPGGHFDKQDAPDWSPTGEAGTTNVAPRGGQFSLRLAPGGSATSRPMCVGLNYPTLRFYARSEVPSRSARVAVRVLFQTPDGIDRQLKIADLSAGDSWEPTRPVLILANLLALFPNWNGQVQFSFTSTGTGPVVIDDVYVDPYER